jgi:hypothetical protein
MHSGTSVTVSRTFSVALVCRAPYAENKESSVRTEQSFLFAGSGRQRACSLRTPLDRAATVDGFAASNDQDATIS